MVTLPVPSGRPTPIRKKGKKVFVGEKKADKDTQFYWFEAIANTKPTLFVCPHRVDSRKYEFTECIYFEALRKRQMTNEKKTKKKKGKNFLKRQVGHPESSLTSSLTATFSNDCTRIWCN